jgi:hypothetical protein
VLQVTFIVCTIGLGVASEVVQGVLPVRTFTFLGLECRKAFGEEWESDEIQTEGMEADKTTCRYTALSTPTMSSPTSSVPVSPSAYATFTTSAC